MPSLPAVLLSTTTQRLFEIVCNHLNDPLGIG